MLLYVASFFIFIFVALNLFFKTACPLAIKILGSILILAISLKYEIYQFLGGAFFSPSLPRAFILAMEALYAGLLILFFLLLLWDIYLAGNWILAKTGFPIPRHLPKGWIKCGLCCVALALGVWGTMQAIAVPAIKRVEISLNKLPQALDGFKLIQLSDLHIGPILDASWLEKVVKKVNATKPDLILLTGDYVDGRVSEIASELKPLANLESRYGVFGVTGNHEYYWDAVQWQKVLKDLNVNMLENEHAIIKAHGEELVIAGLPDLAASRFGLPEPDIVKALMNAPEVTRILLAHQPKAAREYASHVDLHLAGHTHGGVLFFLQPLIARFNNGFVQGLYPVNAGTLYVSSGTGIWNGFSSRVGVPAEITEIILHGE